MHSDEVGTGPSEAAEEEEAWSTDLTEAAWVSCPYCGESVELLIDPGGTGTQEYVEDCEVCCRPWSVRVAVDGSGIPSVSVATLDDE